MARKRDLIPHPGTYRRSLVQGYETCPRRTRFELQAGDVTTGYAESTALLGQAVHIVIHAILRTLRETGHYQMPTQEAIEVMYEQMALAEIVLPAEERDALRWMVLDFCKYKWTTRRILAMEDQLWADLTCPDGVVRTFTGRPDLVMYDGAKGIAIYDWKSGKGRPQSPRQMPPEGEPIVGKKYLSERGHFQLDGYGFLGMTKWPRAEYATLHELHLRSGEVREATLTRAELEHVEREIAQQMQLIDRGIAEGPKSELWRPKPGKQCITQCAVAKSCPIPREMRGIGAVMTQHQADAAAAAWQVTMAQQKQLRDVLKTAAEVGLEGRLPDGKVARWDPPVGQGRGFKVCDPYVPSEEETAA